MSCPVATMRDWKARKAACLRRCEELAKRIKRMKREAARIQREIAQAEKYIESETKFAARCDRETARQTTFSSHLTTSVLRLAGMSRQSVVGPSFVGGKRPDSDVPKLDDQRLTLRDAPSGVNGILDFPISDAVDLEAYKTLRVGLVDILVGEVLDQMTIHPRLNPRPSRDEAQFVPALVNEVTMTIFDLLLR